MGMTRNHMASASQVRILSPSRSFLFFVAFFFALFISTLHSSISLRSDLFLFNGFISEVMQRGPRAGGLTSDTLISSRHYYSKTGPFFRSAKKRKQRASSESRGRGEKTYVNVL